MDFLEDLLEGRRQNGRGRHGHDHHKDDHGIDATANRRSHSGHHGHDNDDDDDWGGHRQDGHFLLLPWREYLKRPIVQAGLAMVSLLLILACLGMVMLAWPWLAKAVAYVNQHGMQGVIEALQNAGNRLWQGNS